MLASQPYVVIQPRPNGDITVTTYSPKWCQGIVERFREFQRASEAYGMPAQPLPVQIQHVGIHGTGTPEERRRVGSIYDLAYIPNGSDIPSGVWALIEWTLEGIELIESGKFNCLSPTNSSYGILSTGRKIPGDFLVEVSLVDVPFLESIGTASDFLPFDYIKYSGTRSATSVARSIPAVWYNLSTENPVISRGAQYRSLPMENEEKVEIELSPEKVTPALVEALMDTEVAREKMRKMCREMMESDLDSAGAAADLDGALKKLNLLQLKNEMTAITQRISSGEASDTDRARYRELGERLKFS
jgi:hypothetical protein